MSEESYSTVGNRDDLYTFADIDDDAGSGVVSVRHQQRLVDHVHAGRVELSNENVDHLLLQPVTEVVWTGEHHL